MSLSPAASTVLTRAAERPDHRLEFHRKPPTGGHHKMIDALLRDGLIAETQGTTASATARCSSRTPPPDRC